MLPAQISSRALSQTFRRELPKYFTQTEMRSILSAELYQKDYSSWFLIYFLSRSGCRISEALSLTVANIDFANRLLHCPTLKRRTYQERTVPITGETAGVIAEFIAIHSLQRHSRLFPFTRKTAYLKVQFACHYAGMNDDERSHPHSFRHTFAINAIMNGIPLPVLQSWLGHRDIANTLIYTQVLAADSHHFVDNLRW